MRRSQTPNPLAPLPALALLCTLPLALPSSGAAQLLADGAQLWRQDSIGVDLPLLDDALFGYALAGGDFDGDGFDDLAIGAPDYDLSGFVDAGLVVVLYGGENGPGTPEIDYWDQGNAGLFDDIEDNDQFGAALAVGDFDGDGFDDLAIGAPNESFEGATSAGAVQILYGGESGLTTTDQFFHQGWGEGLILGTPEQLDRFGFSLAVGKLDGDKYDDLVIGVPYETVSDQPGAGAFHVLFGSSTGLTTDGDRLFYRGNGIADVPASGENLGWSLATGNFDQGNSGNELAVGVPGSSITGATQSGEILVFEDLDGAASSYSLSLDTFLWPDARATGDNFGNALAAGQFDGVGATDLAIGAWGKTAGGQGGAGKVYVHYFSARAVTVLDQTGLPGEQPESDDYFGGRLAAGDFDGNGIADLAVAAYFEDLPGAADAGVVHVLFGVDDAGISKSGAQTVFQEVEVIQAGDRIGLGLAAGRFSGHSGTGLAIGAPYESDELDPWVGAVNVFFSRALFLDSFEHSDALDWSSWVGAE